MGRRLKWAGYVALIVFSSLVVLAFLSGGFQEQAWRNARFIVTGPALSKELLNNISEYGYTRQQVTNWLGKPVFELTTVTGEILIYREVKQSNSGSGYMFGRISTGTYFTSYENILLVEFVGEKSVRHELVNRMYFVPGKDIEFGMDDTAFDKHGIVRRE